MGYVLSSRYMTLNHGSKRLIQVYSSCSASTSEATTVHSTEAPVYTIWRVRGCSVFGGWK